VPEFEEPELEEPALEESEFDEPEFDEPEFDGPALGVGAPGEPAEPGMVEQGEPLGPVPGAVVVFGFTVEGCVLLPGLAGFVELAPGTPEG